MKLLRKGAEANLYLANFQNCKTIIKHRVGKAYRIPQLDLKIRAYRTVHEAELLYEARRIGVPTPIIYFLDKMEGKLFLQYVEGVRLKELLSLIHI